MSIVKLTENERMSTAKEETVCRLSIKEMHVAC